MRLKNVLCKKVCPRSFGVMLPTKQAMTEVAAYQASGEISRMIPVHPQGFEDSAGGVPDIKGVRQFPPKILQDTGSHQRKTTPSLNAFFGAKATIFKAGKEFAVAVRGFNLPTKGVFFNHPLVWHISIGTEVEHDAPATLGTIVEPLGNDQDGLLHPSAVANVMGLIDIFALTFLYHTWFFFDVEFVFAFRLAVKHGIGIESGYVGIVLTKAVDGLGIIAATVVENNLSFGYNPLNSSNKALFLAAFFIAQTQENTAEGKTIALYALVFLRFIDNKCERQHIVTSEKLGLIFIAFAVMRILAKATGSLVFTLRGGMGNIGNEASVGKGSKQEPCEGSDEVLNLPRASSQDLL